MQRKEFIRLATLAAIFTTMPSFKCVDPSRKKKIIIIGAGMSGIAAGRALADAGHDVTIVEARNRIGGRIWSDDSLGTTLDFGASWIEEFNGNPVADLAREYNVETIPTDFDSIYLYDADGTKLDDGDIETVYNETQEVLEEALGYAAELDSDISYQRAIDDVLRGEELNADERRLLNWRISSDEINASIEFDQLSAWGEDEEGFDGYDHLMPNGYGEITRKLSNGLNIQLGHKVTEIIDDNKKVKVITNKKKFNADYVLVTVPLGVLKKNNIKFTPTLSSDKQNAISSLGMGNMNKLAIRFPKIFWPTDRQFITYSSYNKGEFPVFLNWAYFTGKPFLLATMGNAFAHEVQNMSNQERINKVYSIFSKMYPNAVKPDAVKFSGWKWDEFAGGSYSYLPVGVNPKLRDSLAKPHGRVHFAGEATIRGHSATVHGAYLSGLREAERIHEND